MEKHYIYKWALANAQADNKSKRTTQQLNVTMCTSGSLSIPIFSSFCVALGFFGSLYVIMSMVVV
jgi:hypothetical protein